MRPLELSFSGLRSYTEFGPISFEDKSLVGILGDTGAGKSTILEALCVALYGKCSWSERDVKDLIADGARSMSVDFRFTHDGHTWRIRRTYYANTMPSTVLLENLDTHAKFDNARPVDAQIVSMLRLDFTAFKSAVLLPQGRFQTLLHASGRERADLLSGIFGADVIDAVRSLISTRQTALADLVRDAEVARARLRDHPAIAAEDARTAAENAEGRCRALMNSVEALRAAQREAGSTETLGKSLHHSADAAGSAAAQLDGIRPALADVLIAAANIEKSRLSLDTREKQAQVQREQAEAALRAAHDAREGPEDLGRAAGTLTGLGARLDDLTHQSGKIQAEQTRLDAEDLRLTDAANAEPALAANAKRLTVTAGHLAERLEAARTAASNLRERLREALTSAVTDVICSRDARELEKQIAEVEASLPALRTSAGIAAAAHSDAVGVLRAAQRDEAAATIGAHLHPGDACPVCTATLPDGYTPPFPTDPETHTAAETEEERARRAALDAAQALRDAERDLTQLRERAGRAAEKASIATREADRNADAALTAAADRALTDTVPEPEVEGISTPAPIHPEQLRAALIASIEALAIAEDPEASLGRAAVEKLLVDIVAFGAALKNAHADTDSAATAAQTRWTRLQAEHAAARQAYDRDRQALAHARLHVTELRSGMAKDLHTLPSGADAPARPGVFGGSDRN
jgi:exonuclease SbcC